jgi:RND superfamily putative drug exporter
VLAVLGGTTVLLTLALPFAHARFALPDDRTLPQDSEAHQVSQAVRERFAPCALCGIPVVVVPAAGTDDAVSQVAGYAARVSALPGVDRVVSAAGVFHRGELLPLPEAVTARFLGSGDAQWMLVQPTATEPYSAEASALVGAVRALPAPFGVHVGGLSAHARDTQHTLSGRIPLAVGWIALAMFGLLTVFTRSLLIPLKAIVLSALSLTATFGAVVFVFQEGHLRWLVGDFQVSGQLEETTLVLMFFIAFGMSMDYELFLLSRIKESYDRYGDNPRAVMIGLGQTGRTVTSAAVCMVLVLLAFATSSVSALKMLGIGLALAIIADATLVRGVLVPALTGLFGRANWWLPRPVRHAAGPRTERAVTPRT